MAIDFYPEVCKTVVARKVFGLCDDPPPAEAPAYIKEDDNPQWIAIVHNKDEKEIVFHAIDHCVEMNYPNHPTRQASRCDGLLVTDEFYRFVELKDCKLKDQNWRRRGKAQLQATIARFLDEHPSIDKTHVKAHLCNKKHTSKSLYLDTQDDFFEKTGITLIIKRRITL